MNIFVLCRNYYIFSEKRYNIGGIETYIKNLLELLKQKGNVVIIQQYSTNFDVFLDGVRIVGVNTSKKKENTKNLMLIRKAETLANNLSEDLLLFADEQIARKHKFKKCIAIQHGISWDIPNYRIAPKYFALFTLRRTIQAIRITHRLRYVKKLVAVDYNFLNWYRTQVPFVNLQVEVIPNFVNIPSKHEKKTNTQPTIIFARRFQWYRGTRIMAEAIQKLLGEISDVSIIFAGEGPDEGYLRQVFGDDPRIRFIRYQSDESLEIHKKVDIAVIPTVGSEGTSLSLLEAMASHCAVICTNVGGMTNIVLDGFNGKLINPDSNALYNALLNLVVNNELRNLLADNAYYSVRDAFSIDSWKNKWKTILSQYL